MYTKKLKSTVIVGLFQVIHQSKGIAKTKRIARLTKKQLD